MTKYALAAFLVLYGILGLLETKVPLFVLPLVALAAGAIVLFEGKPK